MSIPAITKMLTKGDGSLETFLRAARVLGMLDSVVDATDPLVAPIGRACSGEDMPRRVRSLWARAGTVHVAYWFQEASSPEFEGALL